MFTLQIETANAAFDGAPDEEVARILRRVASQIESGYTDGRCKDVNGNSVGVFALDLEEEIVRVTDR